MHLKDEEYPDEKQMWMWKNGLNFMYSTKHKCSSAEIALFAWDFLSRYLIKPSADNQATKTKEKKSRELERISYKSFQSTDF